MKNHNSTSNESTPCVPAMPSLRPCPRCGHPHPRVERREDGSARVHCSDKTCTYAIVLYPKDLEPLLDAAAMLFVSKLWNQCRGQ
ncbi:MAG TPA: hypothetical protein VLM89_16155 [Phycisphaerae bacterium]|nr:hypothetical protein [Phycisphaerae bacterium]